MSGREEAIEKLRALRGPIAAAAATVPANEQQMRVDIVALKRTVADALNAMIEALEAPVDPGEF